MAWVAPEDSFDSQYGASKGAVFFDRFQAVEGTARCVAAGGGEERRETVAVDVNQQAEKQPQGPAEKARRGRRAGGTGVLCRGSRILRGRREKPDPSPVGGVVCAGGKFP